MSDLIAQGLAWQQAQLEQCASVTVTYQRGAQSVTLTATLSTYLFKILDSHGQAERIEHSDQDFCFAQAELTFDGMTPITPQRGDMVLFTQGSTTRQFQVSAPGNERPWKLDPYAVQLRVHTKYVGTV